MTVPPGRKRGRSREPVELPAWLSHGTATTYNHYRCGCDPCFEWRKEYDRHRAEASILARDLRHDGSDAYLRTKGIRLSGPGPFRKNPYVLAVLVARWAGDDLTVWIDDYARRNST